MVGHVAVPAVNRLLLEAEGVQSQLQEETIEDATEGTPGVAEVPPSTSTMLDPTSSMAQRRNALREDAPITRVDVALAVKANARR